MPRILPTITDEVTNRTRTRCYDVRIACQQYSNIAGLVAGFAFTVLILVAENNNSSISDVEILSRNFAAIGIFVALFVAMLSSFVFAVISGEEALTPRANLMAFFGGASFSLTLALTFWSTAVVLRGFLVSQAATIADQILPFFFVIHPFFVVASILDNILIFDRRYPTFKEYLIAIGPSMLFIVIATVIRWTGGGITLETGDTPFNTVIAGSSIATIFSSANEDFRLNVMFCGTWMSLHAALISVLILLK